MSKAVRATLEYLPNPNFPVPVGSVMEVRDTANRQVFHRHVVTEAEIASSRIDVPVEALGAPFTICLVVPGLGECGFGPFGSVG